jgi:hypothetical protein
LDPVSFDERDVVVEMRFDSNPLLVASLRTNPITSRTVSLMFRWPFRGRSRLIRAAGPTIVVDDIPERIPHFGEIWWISVQKAQGGLRIGHGRASFAILTSFGLRPKSISRATAAGSRIAEISPFGSIVS